MVKKLVDAFDIIEEVNKDLGEDLFFAVEPPDDYVVSAMLADKALGGPTTRLIAHRCDTFHKQEDIINLKKKVLSMCSYMHESMPYDKILENAKNNNEKKRSFSKAREYLEKRYGIKFGCYANSGTEIRCFVIYPDLESRFMPITKFANYYCLWFNGNKVSEKSLKSYCRKMDKVIERLKCVEAAFGGEEYIVSDKNFYKLCEIKKSASRKDWILKFPYTLKLNHRRIAGTLFGSDVDFMVKLMKLYHYKDTDFCIWKASNPAEFEMTREFLKCQ